MFFCRLFLIALSFLSDLAVFELTTLEYFYHEAKRTPLCPCPRIFHSWLEIYLAANVGW